MAVISRSVVIKAPVRKVFDVVTTPDNWTRYVASLVEVKDLSLPGPEKGMHFKWVYRMMGVKFSGKGEVSEYVKNKKFGLRLTGKASVNESYEFMEASDGTSELKVRIEYEMPNEVLQFIANSKLVEKLNNLESKSVLEKIKALSES